MKHLPYFAAALALLFAASVNITPAMADSDHHSKYEQQAKHQDKNKDEDRRKDGKKSDSRDKDRHGDKHSQRHESRHENSSMQDDEASVSRLNRNQSWWPF